MAILVIYRDDMFDREVDLGEGNARIGRGEDNDIVLADVTKSLSRHHAELRFEQGKYSVVDTNSQNGVWVEGLRVLTATLEPGIPVVLGSYKLLLKEEKPPAAETGDETLFLRRDVDLATIVSKPKSAPPPLAAKVGAPKPLPNVAAGKSDPPASKTDPELRAFKPESPPAPRAAAPPAAVRPEPPPPKAAAPMPAVRPEPPLPKAAAPIPAVRPELPPPPAKPAVAAKPPRAARPAGKGMPKGLIYGGIVVVLLAVMAAAVFLTPLRDRLRGPARNEPATPTAAAAPPAINPPPAPPESTPPVPTSRAGASRAGASRGAGARASRGNVTPAPGRPSTPAPPAARTPKPVAETPAPPAARTPTPVPETPTPPIAPPPKPVADTPAPPEAPPPKPTVPPPAAPPAPAAVKEPVVKPLDLAGMFEEARSAMIKGDYLAAIAGFEAVLKVDPNYPSAANLLGVTRGGAKNASQLAIDSGNKAEMSGDYESATKQYERALLLDPPSSAAADAMRRLKARMQIEGEDTFKRGRQYDAMGRKQDAISTYGRALQLLPPDHASAKAARERLAALKGGG